MRAARRSVGLLTATVLAVGVLASAAPAQTTDTSTVPLPDEFLGGYVEAWQSSTFPDDVPHANMTMIAFATTTPNRNAQLSYGMSADRLRAAVAANAAEGKPTILSLGGSGSWHAPTNDAQARTMADDLIRISEDYGFSGLDVNFEGGSDGFNEGNARYTAAMMRQVREHFTSQGQPYSLSIAPYGANPDGQANNTVSRTYQEILRLNVDIIDFVGFQYYNTGFDVDATWVRNVLDHWKSEVPGLTNDQWALGFLGAHDWGGSNTDYATMVDIWRSLQSTHPGIRGVWTWGVNEKESSTGNGFFAAFDPVIDTTASGSGGGVTPQPAVTTRFSDVTGGVHLEAVERLAAAGVINGYADGTFRPTDNLTRGQLAALLDRSLNLESGACNDCPRPTDIAGSTHATSIQNVVAAGVATGYPDGTFAPERLVTRAQLATFLTNALDLPEPDEQHPFGDVRGSTHEEAIASIASAGITTGQTPSSFAPRQHVRRDQMATFLDRALDFD